MSHVITASIRIRDLDALALAAPEIGLGFRRGQRTHRWYGHWVDDYRDKDAAYRVIDPKTFGTCEHALVVRGRPDAYEIGLVKHPDGDGWALVWDFYGHQGQAIMNCVGRNGEKLVQAYGVNAAILLARRKGLRTTRTTNAQGQVVLTVGR